MSVEAELRSDNPVALPGVGDRLKAEREARGLSLDDISQTLKVSRRILDQVEANAWAELPGYTFARGVVRGYAKLVHLDADSLLRELDDAPLPKPPVLEMPRSTHAALPVTGQSQGRDRLAMIAGVLVVASAVMAYVLVPEEWFSGKATAVVTSSAQEPAVPLAAPLPAATDQAIASPAVPVVDPAASPGSGVTTGSPLVLAAPVLPANAANAIVIRFDETSWVEVRDRSGVMLLSENVAAGSERAVSGELPIALALGNAEGVRVTFRGQSVDLKPHTRQKVARLSLE